MKFAVVSDEPYPVNEDVVTLLESRGHSVVRFGSLATGTEAPYAEVALQAAQAVAEGDCDQGVFFCWTGTGISIAANKVPGIRAALCADPETARGARIWNHANVLALSNRRTSSDLAKEILSAWLDSPEHDARGTAAVETISEFESRERMR
ncbi:MAG: RpiB/LacA/LacB family sugar-phosphate isomerase [Myxococcota bacterium]